MSGFRFATVHLVRFGVPSAKLLVTPIATSYTVPSMRRSKLSANWRGVVIGVSPSLFQHARQCVQVKQYQFSKGG